jgi:hypothetical protein
VFKEDGNVTEHDNPIKSAEIAGGPGAGGFLANVLAPKYERMWTRIILMTGTVVLSLAPLYLTSRRDAVYDGALLAVAFAFAADAAFRCFDPEMAGGNRKLALGVISLLILVAAALQYGPIANDLRKEKYAIDESRTKGSVLPLVNFEIEREADEKEIPNDSMALLISSILAEFSVIIFLER